MAFDNVTLVELNVPGDRLGLGGDRREPEAEQEESGGGLPIGKILVGLLVLAAVAFAAKKLKSRGDDETEEPDTEIEYPAADVEVERPEP